MARKLTIYRKAELSFSFALKWMKVWLKVFNSHISCLTNMLDHKGEMNSHSLHNPVSLVLRICFIVLSSRRGSGCLNTILRLSSHPHTCCSSIGFLNRWVSRNIRCLFLKDSIINNTNILYWAVTFFPFT